MTDDKERKGQTEKVAEDPAEQETRSPSEFEMPSCCGPEMARMMGSFGCGPTDKTDSREPATSTKQQFSCKDMMAHCMDMMAQMKKRQSGGGDEEPKSDTAPSGGCGG